MSPGRLVWNHSTHLPGLIAKLEKLLAQNDAITTITPAVIGRARSNTPKLTLRISVPVRGGFKLIARKGKQFQEVFIVTTLDRDSLQAAIAQVLS
jgi:hypothetical protein